MSYYGGHPSPKLKFSSNKVYFDLRVGAHGEQFDPYHEELQFDTGIKELKEAIIEARKIMEDFAKKVVQINDNEGLGIDRIDDFLIWKNKNYE